MRFKLLLSGFILFSGFFCNQTAMAWDCATHGSDTMSPKPVAAKWWRATFDGAVALAKVQHPKIVFLGDSQTEWWPGDIWQQQIVPLHALNFGIHSDLIENLTWRFDHAGADIQNVPMFVVLIGTNNISQGTSSDDIAGDIRFLLHDIHRHNGKAKILLISLLPREHGVNDWVQKAVKNVNDNIQSCGTMPNVRYLDLGRLLQDANGNLNDGMAPDQLHPSHKGYEKITPPLLAALHSMDSTL